MLLATCDGIRCALHACRSCCAMGVPDWPPSITLSLSPATAAAAATAGAVTSCRPAGPHLHTGLVRQGLHDGAEGHRQVAVQPPVVDGLPQACGRRAPQGVGRRGATGTSHLRPSHRLLVLCQPRRAPAVTGGNEGGTSRVATGQHRSISQVSSRSFAWCGGRRHCGAPPLPPPGQSTPSHLCPIIALGRESVVRVAGCFTAHQQLPLFPLSCPQASKPRHCGPAPPCMPSQAGCHTHMRCSLV